MKIRCPNCGDKTLSLLALQRSTTFGPLQCPACGQYSSPSRLISITAEVLVKVLLILSVALAVWYRSAWPLVGFGAVVLVGHWIPALFPLRVSTSQAKKSPKRADALAALFDIALLALLVAAGATIIAAGAFFHGP